MKLTSRLHAAELAIARIRNRDDVPTLSVCDRIDELTLLYMEHSPLFAPQVEAGIIAAVERETRAECELA